MVRTLVVLMDLSIADLVTAFTTRHLRVGAEWIATSLVASEAVDAIDALAKAPARLPPSIRHMAAAS